MDRLLLSRIRLRPSASRDPEFWKRSRNDPLGHHAVWSLFEGVPKGERPFLYRQEASDTPAAFLVLSRRSPVDSAQLWEIESKELAPMLEPGQRLSFTLRASPTIRRGQRKEDDATEQSFVGKRIDVVMDAKRRARARNEDLDANDLVQSATRSWLDGKSERGGFHLEPDAFRAEGYRQHRVPRRGQRPATFSTVDLSGTLRVVDVERFLATMSHGLGPEKAFGCGLLLVRRA